MTYIVVVQNMVLLSAVIRFASLTIFWQKSAKDHK